MNFKILEKEKVLIAVSGGPDSMFLLSKILKHKTKFKKTLFAVANVNYNFRTNSIQDARIVKNFCEKNNIDFFYKEIDKSVYASLKENFESWARKVRYDWFAELAKDFNFSCVAIAHNRNDSIETYLMQIQKNTINNCFGLQEINEYKNVKIIRPILTYKKSEILDYLNRWNIPYIIDYTNNDPKYLRNKIRSALEESSFDSIESKIFAFNTILKKAKTFKDVYFDQNFSKTKTFASLRIVETSLLNIDLVNTSIILYEFLRNSPIETELHHRKNNLVDEIIRRLNDSTKSYWEIALKNGVIIKDRDYLIVTNKDNIQQYHLLIKSKEEINNYKDKLNDLAIQEIIKIPHYIFPIYVSTNSEKYNEIAKISHTKYVKKYFKDNKISYFARKIYPLIYKVSDNISLNIETFSYFNAQKMVY